MEIEGMIIRDLGEIGGISKAGNQWKKHQWLLETLGQYPRKVKIDVFGEKTNTLVFEVGKSYVIQVDVESREFNERWYTDIQAYAARLSENQGMGMPQTGAPQFEQPVAPAQPTFAQPEQPVVPSQNPFGSQTPDFAAGDSSEDLPF